MIVKYDYIDKKQTDTLNYGLLGDAGADLAVARDTLISPLTVTKVPTNVRVEIPPGNFGLLCLRSGFSTQRLCGLINGVGIIDSGYRGEILIPVYSFNTKPFTVHEGDRIAQLVVLSHRDCHFVWAPLSPSERGTGGFGSTGT